MSIFWCVFPANTHKKNPEKKFQTAVIRIIYLSIGLSHTILFRSKGNFLYSYRWNDVKKLFGNIKYLIYCVYMEENGKKTRENYCPFSKWFTIFHNNNIYFIIDFNDIIVAIITILLLYLFIYTHISLISFKYKFFFGWGLDGRKKSVWMK